MAPCACDKILTIHSEALSVIVTFDDRCRLHANRFPCCYVWTYLPVKMQQEKLQEYAPVPFLPVLRALGQGQCALSTGCGGSGTLDASSCSWAA